MSNSEVIQFEGRLPVRLMKWKVKRGANLSSGSLLFIYEESGEQKRFKSTQYGLVTGLMVQEGEMITPGQTLVQFESCAHTTVMKDLCAECGLDLRKSGKLYCTTFISSSTNSLFALLL
jgi:RNA polymerase II subunit A-like phosphatase